jgi:hypothetical protein
MGRSTPNASASSTFADALEATGNLFNEDFLKLNSSAEIRGLAAHSEIRNVSVASKSAVFFRHYLPLREQMISLLSDTYRRFLKLALANSRQTRVQPEQWASIQMQPAIHAALQWIREWYILACEGENKSIRVLTAIQVVQSGEMTFPIPNSVPELPRWLAPSWLFQISLALFGIGMMKQEHVPKRESEERLGESHTRLLLKGAKRVFLWDLQGVCQTIRNEEIAAAGALPETPTTKPREPRKRKAL